MPSDRQHLDDRQLDAILQRLDRLCDEVHTLNRRLDTNDQLQRISRELGNLNESLQALAYARSAHRGRRCAGADPPRSGGHGASRGSRR